MSGNRSQVTEVKSSSGTTPEVRLSEQATIPNAIRGLGDIIGLVPQWKEALAAMGKSATYAVANLIEGKQDWYKGLFADYEKLVTRDPKAEEYTKTSDGQDLWTELLKLLNLESSYKKLDAVKRIFLNAIATAGTAEEIPPIIAIRYLRSCSELEIEDLVALKANYDIRHDPDLVPHGGYHDWASRVASHLHYGSSDAMAISHERLAKEGLVQRRTAGDNSGMSLRENFGITAHGMGFCRFAFEDRYLG